MLEVRLDNSGANMANVEEMPEDITSQYIFTDEDIASITTDLMYLVGWHEDQVFGVCGRMIKYDHTQPLSVYEPYSKDFPRNGVANLRGKRDQIIEIKALVPFSENRGYCPSQAFETQ